jgi:hypothetical protein
VGHSTETLDGFPRRGHEPPAAAAEEARAARLAGALITVTSVVALALWPIDHPSTPTALLFARMAGLALHLLLGVPLMFGIRRFRWLAVVVACLGLEAAILKELVPGLLGGSRGVLLYEHVWRYAEDCLYVAALLVLLTGRANRARLRLGGWCIWAFFALWGLRRVSYLVSWGE